MTVEMPRAEIEALAIGEGDLVLADLRAARSLRRRLQHLICRAAPRGERPSPPTLSRKREREKVLSCQSR